MDDVMFGVSEVSYFSDRTLYEARSDGIGWVRCRRDGLTALDANLLMAAPSAWQMYAASHDHEDRRRRAPPIDAPRVCAGGCCDEMQPAENFGMQVKGKHRKPTRNPRCFPCSAAYQRQMRTAANGARKW